MQNVTSKLGLTFKHSRYAPQRFDFTKQTNITAIQEKLRKLVLFSEDYINQMNAFKLAKVNDTDIENYVLNSKLFFADRVELLEKDNAYFGITQQSGTPVTTRDSDIFLGSTNLKKIYLHSNYGY